MGACDKIREVLREDNRVPYATRKAIWAECDLIDEAMLLSRAFIVDFAYDWFRRGYRILDLGIDGHRLNGPRIDDRLTAMGINKYTLEDYGVEQFYAEIKAANGLPTGDFDGAPAQGSSPAETADSEGLICK